MNSEARWTPELLGEMTLAHLRCLESAEPPGSAPVLDSLDAYDAAMAALAAEESAWWSR
jgi:hypothetical protein